MSGGNGAGGGCAYAGRVFVVDNGRVATALHVTVLDALRLRDAGDDAATIKQKLEDVREDMCIYVAVETLEHLKRGGRISTATALIGTLLHIKPILHFTTGTLGAYKKARGMNRAQDVMIEAIRAELAGRFAEPAGTGAGDAAGGIECFTGSDGSVGSAAAAGISGTAAAV